MHRFPFEAAAAADAENITTTTGDRTGTPDNNTLSDEPMNIDEIPALIGRKLNPRFANRLIRRIGKR